MDKTLRRKYWRQWCSRVKTHEQEGGGYVWGKCKSLLDLAACGQKVSAELKGA